MKEKNEFKWINYMFGGGILIILNIIKVVALFTGLIALLAGDFTTVVLAFFTICGIKMYEAEK